MILLGLNHRRIRLIQWNLVLQSNPALQSNAVWAPLDRKLPHDWGIVQQQLRTPSKRQVCSCAAVLFGQWIACSILTMKKTRQHLAVELIET
jgi:hypothetical protein